MNSTGSTRFAGGKINLRLKVTARRPDGFHELDTIFYPLDFPADEVSVDFDAAPGIELVCNRYIPGGNERNLALLAAQRYAEKSSLPGHWQISLKKNLPIAAGFGGGSSDAGAVLQILNERYNALSEDQLAELALSLGADVPFFLKRLPVRATGVGEIFENFALPSKMPGVLLVHPGFPVSAKWAYQQLSPEYIGVGNRVTPADYEAAFADPANADWDELLRNDLAFALWEKFPLLRLLKNFILEHGAWAVQISGSGSGMFALFENTSAASSCAAALRQSRFGTAYTGIFAGNQAW